MAENYFRSPETIVLSSSALSNIELMKDYYPNLKGLSSARIVETMLAATANHLKNRKQVEQNKGNQHQTNPFMTESLPGGDDAAMTTKKY